MRAEWGSHRSWSWTGRTEDHEHCREVIRLALSIAALQGEWFQVTRFDEIPHITGDCSFSGLGKWFPYRVTFRLWARNMDENRLLVFATLSLWALPWWKCTCSLSLMKTSTSCPGRLAADKWCCLCSLWALRARVLEIGLNLNSPCP